MEKVNTAATVPAGLVSALYSVGNKSTIGSRLAILERREVARQTIRLETLSREVALRPTEVALLPYRREKTLSRNIYEYNASGGCRIAGGKFESDSAFIGWAVIAPDSTSLLLPVLPGSEDELDGEMLLSLYVGTVVDLYIDVDEFGYIRETTIEEDDESND